MILRICDPSIPTSHEIMRSDWLKLIRSLAAANQSDAILKFVYDIKRWPDADVSSRLHPWRTASSRTEAG